MTDVTKPIAAVDAVPVTVPYRAGVERTTSAIHTMASADHVIIRVRDADGVEGIGEAPARPTLYGETTGSIVAFVRDHATPAMLGGGADPRALRRDLNRLPGNPAAKAAIDIALWDLNGRRHGRSLSQLMSGSDTAEIAMTATMLFGEPTVMARSAEALAGQGYRSIKIKVGRDPATDVEAVRAIRHAMGPEVDLLLDANQQWDLDAASHALAALLDAGICPAIMEEPVPHRDLPARIRLKQRFPIAFSSDESVCDLQDAVRELNEGISDVYCLKATRTGLTTSLDIAELLRASGRRAYVATMRELSFGTVANAHLAAFLGCAWAELSPVLLFEHGLATTACSIDDARFSIPARPGLGLDVDETALANYSTEVPA